jgi:hypothetical protein
MKKLFYCPVSVRLLTFQDSNHARQTARLVCTVKQLGASKPVNHMAQRKAAGALFQ